MKTISKLLFAATLLCGISFAAQAQSSLPSNDPSPLRFDVITRLIEKSGSYEQRKLYREFLTEHMKDCPYISHFNVLEADNYGNNQEVVWTYQVNRWSDITKFYDWINHELMTSKNQTLLKALAPFAPNYGIGGQIRMEKRIQRTYAKE